jgi:hypothetical protein
LFRAIRRVRGGGANRNLAGSELRRIKIQTIAVLRRASFVRQDLRQEAVERINR